MKQDTIPVDIEKPEAEALLQPRMEEWIEEYLDTLPPDRALEAERNILSFLMKVRKALDSGRLEPRPPAGFTSLYRFFDAKGRLLYVGITNRGKQRWSEHSTVQPWWPKVATATIEHFGTRLEAQVAEAKAIRNERPPHNKVTPDVESLLLLLVAGGLVDDEP